jgi:predicted DNA-binding transcriptional regulator AlpA
MVNQFKHFRRELLLEIQQLKKPKRLFTIEETGHYLGLAPKTIRNYLSDGIFPVKPKKIGGRVLFRKDDLDKFIDEL